MLTHNSMESLFTLLADVSEQQSEQEILFNKIVYEWEKIDDIDYSILNEEILLALLKNSCDLISVSSGFKELVESLEDGFLSVPRVRQKKRLL